MSKPPKISTALDIRNASVQELERWLHNAPKEDSKMWRDTAAPLVRCAQLDRHDLFTKWRTWGCSLRGSYPQKSGGMEVHTAAIAAVCKANKDAALWLLHDNPQTWMETIGLLRSSDAGTFYALDWSRIIHSGLLPQDALQDLAFLSLVDKSQFLNTSDILRLTKGALHPPSFGKKYPNSFVSSITQDWQWNALRPFQWVDDNVLSMRINNLPSDVLTQADVRAFLKYNYMFGATAIMEQLAFNNQCSFADIAPAKSQVYSWSTWARAMNDPSYKKYPAHELTTMWDTVLQAGFDIKHIDHERRTVLHALVTLNWPLAAVEHIINTVWNTKSILFTQKDIDGHTCRDIPARPELVYYLDSLSTTKSLNNAFAHQINAPALDAPATSEYEAPRRRRM